MKRLITYIALCLTCAVACEQLPEDVQIYGVGCKMKEVALGIDAGEYALEVYADGEFTAALDENDNWIRFSDYEDSRKISAPSSISTFKIFLKSYIDTLPFIKNVLSSIFS